MFTPSRVAVLMILVLILSFASWSKLRFVDADDHMSQRWRLEEHPQFQDEKASDGNTLWPETGKSGLSPCLLLHTGLQQC